MENGTRHIFKNKNNFLGIDVENIKLNRNLEIRVKRTVVISDAVGQGKRRIILNQSLLNFQ